MTRRDSSSRAAVAPPAVLSVGGDPTVLRICKNATTRAAAQLVLADVATAGEIAREVRPLVIVVPKSLFDFDPEGFDDLANRVGAELLALEVDGDCVGGEIEIALALARASRSRLLAHDEPRSESRPVEASPGRYTLVPHREEHTSRPPPPPRLRLVPKPKDRISD